VDPGKQLTGHHHGCLHVLVPGMTRLLLKVVMRTARWAAPGLSVGDLVMARRQLLNLKQLTERHQRQATAPARYGKTKLEAKTMPPDGWKALPPIHPNHATKPRSLEG
jgi:hypothetical protein